MSTIKKLKEFHKNVHIENILIFVSDALRWDYTPESIKKQGIPFKTVAASIFTASSFPSILTGLYPYNHQVYKFFDKLPAYIPSLLDVPGFETSLYCENTWIDWEPEGGSQIHDVMGCGPPVPLEEITPPFVYVEDERGGHCPYGWTENGPYGGGDCVSFFKDYSVRPVHNLRERYKQGISRSVTEFEKRLSILEKRGIRDETLVIFASDHGELLGEYGYLIGHGNFTTPELVYVPTVFVHPDLAQEHTEDTGVIRHVDLFPTIIDFLGVDKRKYTTEGYSLLDLETLPLYGKSFFKFKYGHLSYTERGVWDAHGGYVFKKGLLSRILWEIQCLVYPTSLNSIYLRGKIKTDIANTIKSYPTRMRTELDPQLQFGSPAFGIAAAREMAQDIPIKFNKKNILDAEIASLKQKGIL
ncbi:MAG: sulfatase-like hydrolase/transferase [Candidatus Methanofastidiosia archaeon]|jgi:hypothetical protein